MLRILSWCKSTPKIKKERCFLAQGYCMARRSFSLALLVLLRLGVGLGLVQLFEDSGLNHCWGFISINLCTLPDCPCSLGSLPALGRRQDCAVSFLHEMLFKRIFFYRSCRGGISFFLAKKGNKNASGLSYATLPTGPIHKIQQTQAWPTWNDVHIKSMPLPTHRLSIAVFFSVAGYSPFRTIKVRSKGKNGNII